MVTPQKPLKRERKHSTSSTSSGSCSSYRSHPQTPPRPHPLPTRASSDPILYPAQKLSPWTAVTTSGPVSNTPPCPPSETALWSPPSQPHTVTSGTPGTEPWQQSDLVTRPFSTAIVPNHTWSDLNTSDSFFANWMSPPPVETVVPGQTWYPQTLLNASIWQDHSVVVGPGNPQQNGRVESLVPQNSRFYSLFSKEVSTTTPPLLDFQPSAGDADHVTNTENRLDDTNLASTSTEDDPSFDEWPNI